MARRQSDATGCVMVFVYLIAIEIILAALALAACYALAVAITGGIWSAVEAWRRHRGRPYVEPSQRFRAVWTRGVSPIDRRNWVTPEWKPATDPHLLPGQVTGGLRIEDCGVERVDEPGPLERLVVHARIHNHGSAAVLLGDLDYIDLQVWNPEGKVVGTDTTWPQVRLEPGYTCDADITVRLVDDQPVASWAVGHRAAFAPYVFFPVAASPRATLG